MLLTTRTSFPYYGNVGVCQEGACAPAYGDCEYASAADWVIVMRGVEPSEAEVIGAYQQVTAGWPANQGIANMWEYWARDGFAGVHADHGPSLYNAADGTHPTDELEPGTVRAQVQAHGALLATLTDPETPDVTHEVVVAGFTPTGPAILTWGGVHQMSWTEWAAVSIVLSAPETIAA